MRKKTKVIIKKRLCKKAVRLLAELAEFSDTPMLDKLSKTPKTNG